MGPVVGVGACVGDDGVEAGGGDGGEAFGVDEAGDGDAAVLEVLEGGGVGGAEVPDHDGEEGGVGGGAEGGGEEYDREEG